MENLIDRIKQLAHAQREEVIEWRRWMHRHPDLSQEEYGTMEFVAERLRAMGLEPKTGIGKTGVMAMLEGRGVPPCTPTKPPLRIFLNISYRILIFSLISYHTVIIVALPESLVKRLPALFLHPMNIAVCSNALEPTNNIR